MSVLAGDRASAAQRVPCHPGADRWNWNWRDASGHGGRSLTEISVTPALNSDGMSDKLTPNAQGWRLLLRLKWEDPPLKAAGLGFMTIPKALQRSICIQARDWCLINKYDKLLAQQLKASKRAEGFRIFWLRKRYSGSLFSLLYIDKLNSTNQLFLCIPAQKEKHPFFVFRTKLEFNYV